MATPTDILDNGPKTVKSEVDGSEDDADDGNYEEKWKEPTKCCWIPCENPQQPSGDALTQHLQDDLKKGQFICQWENCTRKGQTFGARHQLIGHLKSHTGEKPFKCSQCGHRFSRSDGLSKHMKRCRKVGTVVTTQEPQGNNGPSVMEDVEEEDESKATWKEKYEILKAKFRYILKETEGMQIEYDDQKQKYTRLKMERNAILERMAKNVGL